MPRSNQIRNKLSLFSVDRGRIWYMCLWSDNTRTLITRGRTRLNKTLFLRTFHDQYRRRQVVDQCSLWKERPLEWYNRARLLINMRHSFKLTRIELEIYITFATQIKPYCLSNLVSYCLSFPILMERVVTSNEFHLRANMLKHFLSISPTLPPPLCLLIH